MLSTLTENGQQLIIEDLAFSTSSEDDHPHPAHWTVLTSQRISLRVYNQLLQRVKELEADLASQPTSHCPSDSTF